MAKVLIICGDLPPFPGHAGSGAGLRALGLGMGLRAKGHEVTWAVPRLAIPQGRNAPAEVAEHLFVREELDQFIAARKPEAVVFQHWTLLFGLKPIDAPTIIDLHGPVLLETLYQDNPDLPVFLIHKVHSFRQADFFTCAGELQKHYWYPWLTLAEHDLRREIIQVVPLSLSPDLPGRKPNKELTLVYGGFFLPWQDPVWVLTQVVQALERRGRGHLLFFGGRHPFLKGLGAGVYEELERRLAASPRVRLMGVVSRAKLLEHYAQATAAVDLMARNPERELAFNSRTVEYLWAGLPVIHQPWSELAGYIRAGQAGWLVEVGDQAGLDEALAEIFDDPAGRDRRSHNAQELVRERLTWDKTIDPLDQFIRAPRVNRPPQARLSLRMRRRSAPALAADLGRVLLRQGPAELWRQLSRRLNAPRT